MFYYLKTLSLIKMAIAFVVNALVSVYNFLADRIHSGKIEANLKYVAQRDKKIKEAKERAIRAAQLVIELQQAVTDIADKSEEEVIRKTNKLMTIR